MPFISVIIPVYKVEQYLQKCIDGVLSQAFSDIEVILVDDGSPDNCPDICDKYADIDKRVKVIHKINEGLSAARNSGICAANGKYLMFLDSDDYWEGKNCLDNLVHQLTKKEVDVLVHGCKDYSCLTGKITISRTGYCHEIISTSSKEDVLKYFFASGMFPGSAWITVTRREFIINNNLFFIKGIKAEDIDWLMNVFLHADSFSSIDDCFYIYLKYRNDSITGTADIQSIKDILFTIDKWDKIFRGNEYEYIRPYANSYLAFQYFSAFVIYNNLPKADKTEAAEHIMKRKHILQNLKTKKSIAAYSAFTILGLRFSSKLFSAYHNLKKR